MKAKRILFLAIPAMFLTSCGPGAEITDSKELSDKAEAIAAKNKEIKNFKFTVDIDSNSYDEDAKKNVNTKSKTVYEKNEDGDIRVHSVGTVDGKETTNDFYLVSNAKYQQVLYTDDFDGENHDISVYGYEGNELTFGFASLTYALPEAYLSAFSDPTLLIGSDVESSYEGEVSLKYFSTGDGNLTIEATTSSNSVEESREAAVWTKEVIRYDNYFLKSASTESRSNKGNVSKMEFSLEVKDKFAINLPSGWEELINKTITEEE